MLSRTSIQECPYVAISRFPFLKGQLDDCAGRSQHVFAQFAQWLPVDVDIVNSTERVANLDEACLLRGAPRHQTLDPCHAVVLALETTKICADTHYIICTCVETPRVLCCLLLVVSPRRRLLRHGSSLPCSSIFGSRHGDDCTCFVRLWVCVCARLSQRVGSESSGLCNMACACGAPSWPFCPNPGGRLTHAVYSATLSLHTPHSRSSRLSDAPMLVKSPLGISLVRVLCTHTHCASWISGFPRN
jgi:hypothetical protein